MGKPKEEVKEKSYYRDIYFLYEALGTLKNIEEVKIFFKDILTKSELRMLKRRWHIANLLMQGKDIREISTASKCSTQTVSKVKNILEDGHGGLRLALDRVLTTQKKETKIRQDSYKPRGSSKFVKGWFK